MPCVFARLFKNVNMTKYTNKQRKRFYKVKAKVKPTKLPSIPKGNAINARNGRKSIIKQVMPEYYGVYYCPAIGSNVVVNSKISLHKAVSASIENAKSTAITLMLREIIGKAEFIYKTKPKDNKGQKSFSEIRVLAAIVKGVGYAKLTIGKYKDGITDIKAPFCHYCINHLSIHKLKNKEKDTAPYHDAP